MGMHTIEPNLVVAEALPALSRAAAAYDTPGVDVNGVIGQIHYLISLGDKGAAGTLDAKVQESDDNVTFTDVVGAAFAIAQLAAAGTAKLKIRVRQTKKRYVRVRVTVAVNACVFGVTEVHLPAVVQ